VSASWFQNHIFSEFIIDPQQLTLPPHDREPMDAQVLRWFLEMLRTREVCTYNKVDIRTYPEPLIPSGRPGKPKKPLEYNLRPILIAVAGLSMMTASVVPLPDEDDQPRRQMREKLLAIRLWFEDMIARWKKSNTLLSWDFSVEILHKIGWMLTLEGQWLVQQIIEHGVERKSASLMKDLIEDMGSLKLDG
jgi:hypothetical protein